MRTLQLNIDQEFIRRAGAEGIDGDALYQAIGRLACWALPDEDGNGYDSVNILPDREAGDMTAVYRSTKNPEKRYVIGAIWHGDHYGFHS